MAVIAYKNFQPEKQRINAFANDLYADFKNALLDGNISKSRQYLLAACRLNKSYKKSAYEDILKIGLDQSDSNATLATLRLSYEYSPQVLWKKNHQVIASAIRERKITRTVLIEDIPAFKEYPRQIQINIISIVWPPSWKVTFGPKEFIGNGMSRKERVKTLKFGTDYNNGDRITIIGKDFLALAKEGWVGPDKKGQCIIMPTTHGGGHILVRNPEGKIFETKVEKFY